MVRTAVFFSVAAVANAVSCSIEDQVKLADGAYVGDTQYKCAKSALNMTGIDHDSFVGCVQSELSISASCSECYYTVADYGFKNCKALCLHGWCTSGCLSCTQPAQDDLSGCTGFQRADCPCCMESMVASVASSAACADGAEFPLPPRHVIASTTGEDGTVTRRWYDDALTKARAEYDGEFETITSIFSCNDGTVVETSHDSSGCQTKEQPVQCVEDPFFALWSMGNADLRQTNCTGLVDCPSSAEQCEVWSIPTSGSYDGDTFVGTLQVYIKSGTEEVDTFSLTGDDGAVLASLAIDIWDTSSPSSSETFNIPEQWDCTHLPALI